MDNVTDFFFTYIWVSTFIHVDNKLEETDLQDNFWNFCGRLSWIMICSRTIFCQIKETIYKHNFFLCLPETETFLTAV